MANHTDNNHTTRTVAIAGLDDQRIFGKPSGPCIICGRPSKYPCPFKDDAFECEFLCGWPVPRDIRARLRRLKEQEDRQEAELLHDDYEADDEGGDAIQDVTDLVVASGVTRVHHKNDDKNRQRRQQQQQASSNKVGEDHGSERLVAGSSRPAEARRGLDDHAKSGGRSGGVGVTITDVGGVNVHEEMHKTLFPKGVPWRPLQSSGKKRKARNHHDEDGDKHHHHDNGLAQTQKKRAGRNNQPGGIVR